MERLTLLETGFEGYPVDYVTHNLPLIVLSGLQATDGPDESTLPQKYQEGSLKINSELPEITGPKAEQLIESFRQYEKSDDVWTNRAVVEGSSVTGFKFKVVGRVR